MTSPATLRSEVKDRLHPVIEQKGFSREQASSLFTPFRRERDGKVHVVEIQWDKYQRPAFVLNFGEAQSGELVINGVRVAAGRVTPAECRLNGRLQRYRCGSAGCWFRLRKPWVEMLTTGKWNFRPDEVADEVAQAFGEMEEWFASKAEGPHIYIPRAGR